MPTVGLLRRCRGFADGAFLRVARRCGFLCAAWAAFFSLVSQPAPCQQRPEIASSGPESEIAIESGASVGNVHIFCFADNRRLTPFGFEYDRHSWGHLVGAHVDYVGEVLPVVLVNEPASYRLDSTALTTARKVHYGFGLSPIGVRMMWRSDRSFSPYLIAKGGMIYFKDRILSAQSMKLNFTAQFGGGVETTLRSGLGLRLGYSNFHISNGDVAPRNPGIDFMFINAGLSFPLRGFKPAR